MDEFGSIDTVKLNTRLNSGQYLRFEGVMAALSRHVAPAEYETLLRCFDNCMPVEAHRLLAHLLDCEQEHIVLTTNFDTLIERARAPSKSVAYITDEEHRAHENGLFKIHGTVGRWNAQTGSIEKVGLSERPAATIDEVGFIRHSGVKRERVLEALANADITIVAGYSASDIFDITAWLKESKPKKLLWIDHVDSSLATRLWTGKDLQGQMLSQDKSLAVEVATAIASKCPDHGESAIRFARVPTGQFWPCIASALGVALTPAKSISLSSWEKPFTDWCLRLSRDEKHWLTAAVCAEAGEPLFALYDVLNREYTPTSEGARLLKAHTRDRPERGHLYARLLIAHERASARKPHAAFEFIEQLENQANPRWQYIGTVLRGQVLQQQRIHAQALSVLARAEKIAKRNEFPAPQVYWLKARVNRDLMNQADAYAAAATGLYAAAREGNLVLEAQCLHELAKSKAGMARSSNDFDDALGDLAKANDLRLNLTLRVDILAGWNVCGVMHLQRADLLRLEGRNRASIEKARRNALYYINMAEEIATAIGRSWDLHEVRLSRCWYLLKGKATDDALMLTQKLPLPLEKPRKKEDAKREVLRGYLALMTNNNVAAKASFRRVSDVSEDKVCRAAARAGLGLCETDVTIRRKALREAQTAFETLSYFRGAMMCERLAKRATLEFECAELPDALL